MGGQFKAATVEGFTESKDLYSSIPGVSFKIPVKKTYAYQQAGNAVPINVVEKICYKIVSYLLLDENKYINNKKAS